MMCLTEHWNEMKLIYIFLSLWRVDEKMRGQLYNIGQVKGKHINRLSPHMLLQMYVRSYVYLYVCLFEFVFEFYGPVNTDKCPGPA